MVELVERCLLVALWLSWSPSCSWLSWSPSCSWLRCPSAARTQPSQLPPPRSHHHHHHRSPPLDCLTPYISEYTFLPCRAWSLRRGRRCGELCAGGRAAHCDPHPTSHTLHLCHTGPGAGAGEGAGGGEPGAGERDGGGDRAAGAARRARRRARGTFVRPRVGDCGKRAGGAGQCVRAAAGAAGAAGRG
eukprot:28238-Chlamydomonas_euryale.AAC.3